MTTAQRDLFVEPHKEMATYQLALSLDIDTGIIIFGIYQEHRINEKPHYNTLHVEGIDKKGGVEIEKVGHYFTQCIDKLFNSPTDQVKKVGQYVFDVDTSKGINGIEKFCSKFIHELVENDYYFIDM